MSRETRPDPRAALIERVLENMDTSGYCWPWKGHRDGDGYGNLTVAGHFTRAHRVAYELFVGPIPEGMLICHHCDNPPCVRPSHLFLGTSADNLADMRAKGRWPAAPLPHASYRGIRNGRAKLTDDDVREIRHRYAAGGVSQEELGRHYGVSQVLISHVVRRESWRHVPSVGR